DRAEWKAAYASAVAFIRAKCPEAKLVLTLCTPLNNPEKDAISRALNTCTLAVSAAEALPVIDLYAAVAGLDKTEHMSDVFHWKDTGKELQAEAICAFVSRQLGQGGGNVQLATEMGPDGAMK
ncbi:MAG: SGNH/GDSL hydrolase family protein, partial [Clostridia bacterium]|nr:SGNH/GDSL hydrolase family protein [Clostridia bacterium]